jgi:hypothetical protein
LFIPDPDPFFLPIPDPGVKKAPEPGSATLLFSLQKSTCVCCIAGEGRASSAALGEVTVDFCLGPALERDGERGGPDAVWPMFVLWGDGAVYTVLCYTREQACASGTYRIRIRIRILLSFRQRAFKMTKKKVFVN